MKLSDYGEFPADVPVIIEDDIFLYPFMIAPLFLSDDSNIDAVTKAVDENSLVVIAITQPANEGERDFDAIYKAGVIGSIMRKVLLPDGRVKILFQGLARAEILSEVSTQPLIANVDILKLTNTKNGKIEAISKIAIEKVRILSTISKYFPSDLLRTIEENGDANRTIDLIASTLKLKKEQNFKLFWFLWLTLLM